MADVLCSVSHLLTVKSFDDGHDTGAMLVVLWFVSFNYSGLMIVLDSEEY